MASPHISHVVGSVTVLCGHEEVKECITLAPGARVQRLFLEDSGAPAVCPECVVAHVMQAWATDIQKGVALGLLLGRVTAEMRGRQSPDTVMRYTDAVVVAAKMLPAQALAAAGAVTAKYVHH